MRSISGQMNRASVFGIIGGYGAAGRAVASELVRSSDGQILVGGRDRARADQLAASLGRTASAAMVDLLDDRLLDEFCSACSVVINCAAPVQTLRDRVAQAAVRCRCHYADAAGMSVVKESLQPRVEEIAEAQLSFVVSGGWTPGVSELVPAYAYAQGKARLDRLDAIRVYTGDQGNWSPNALRDGVWFLRQTGLRRPTYFHRGERTRAPNAQTFATVDLGPPLGRCRFGIFSLPELEDLGRRRCDTDVFGYAYLSGMTTAAASFVLAVVPLPAKMGVRLMRGVFRRNILPVGGFVVAQAIGHYQGQSLAFTTRVTFDVGRDYWIHGTVLATVARLLADGSSVPPGVHFLADAVDPIRFVNELRKAGVDATDTFDPLSP